MLECGGLNQQTCQEYFNKNNITNLTIFEKIESKRITLFYGKNYFSNRELDIGLIENGSIPIIRLISNSSSNSNGIYLVLKTNDSSYPDYVCSNYSSSTGDLIGLRNFTWTKSYVKSSKSNLEIKFIYEDANLVNLTTSSAYSSFGSFQPYLMTKFGGNLYSIQSTNIITVKNIDEFPFQSKILHYNLLNVQ
jgi:hypothetical protein